MNASRPSWCAALIALFAIGAVASWHLLGAAPDAAFPPGATAGQPETAAIAALGAPPQEPADFVARSAATPPISTAPPLESVRVHGHVLRSGVAAPGTELSFHAARDAWRERAVDWTITDRNGRYELELPPDCYLVDLQDTGPHAMTIVVRPGVVEQIVDLVLPDVLTAPSRTSRGATGRR